MATARLSAQLDKSRVNVTMAQPIARTG